MRLRSRRTTVVTAVLAVACIAAAPGIGGLVEPTDTLVDALAESEAVAPVTVTERATVPEDRFALAGGCYVVRSEAAGTYVERTDGGFAATAADSSTAEPFHLQAYDLGKYLLFASQADFLAVDDAGTSDVTEPVLDTVEGGVRGSGDENLQPARDPVLTGTGSARDATVEARAATRAGTVVAAAEPGAAAEWVIRDTGDGAFTLQLPVDDGAEDDPGPLDPPIEGTLAAGGDGALSLASGDAPGDAGRFTFALADGCAAWPEVEVNVSGDPATGDTGYEETRGYLDAHLHMMAFEFLGGRVRCGRPWHPYGVTYALVDCEDHEPGGRGAVLEQVLSGQNPGESHDTTGWPTFGYWPKHDSYTHEQVYYRWLERAWRGGLRMFTNLLVDNGVLCEVYPYKENSCNEMDGVRLQAQRLRELERYIDAQYGGPGEGWLRIVDDPFEARRVINAGKLAVVMGIEVSVLFDCGEYLGTPRCDESQIDEELAQVYDIGVRQLELVNKFDNALSGVAGDTGSTGVVVNQGNRYETGHYWMMDTCQEPDGHDHHAHDKTQPNFHDDSGAPDEFSGRDALAGAVLAAAGTSGAAPVYPEGPHCNTMGLSPLGTYLLERMMDRGMLFDPDHMSAEARAEALEVIDAADYSGVVSSHSWADDVAYQRIWTLGGVVAPMSKAADGFVDKWRDQRSWADDRFLFGLGYGADTNGFAAQGGPRNPGEANDVDYPFTGLGGVVIDQQVSGEREYDLNTDGVAHYGLYPDWIEDLRVLAGPDGDQLLEDLGRGPEAYLQMWERAIGIAPNACRPDVDDLPPGHLKRARPGMTPEEVLAEVGQPDAREGNTFSYCVKNGTATVTFGQDGTVSDVSIERAAGGGSRGTVAGSVVAADGSPSGKQPVRPGPPVDDGVIHDHATHDHGARVLGSAASASWVVVALQVVLLGGAAIALARRRRGARDS